MLVQYSRANGTFPINVEPGTTSISRQSGHAGVFKSCLAVEQRVPFRFREVGLKPEHSMNTVRDQLDQTRFNLLCDQIHTPAEIHEYFSWLGVDWLSQWLRIELGSTAVADSAVSELNLRCVGLSLPGLIGVAAIGELNKRLLVAACLLRVGVTAVEKSGHGVFNQAGSGPRSMA